MTKFKKWQIHLVTACSGMLVYLDVSAIPIAIPLLEKEFSLSLIEGLWVINVYLLALLAFFPLSSKFADIFGKKTLFLSGFGLFGVGSILIALSTSGWWLIVSRGIQGIGGALCFPVSTSLLVDHFPSGERSKAIGINTAVSAFFLLVGPAVGGFFVEYLSWRYIFWINVPIVFCGLLISYWVLSPDRRKKVKIHLLGAIVIMAASSSIVVALMQGGEWGWGSILTLSFFVLFIILTILFIKINKKSKHPIIDFSLFESYSFNMMNFCIFLTQVLLVFNIFLAIYLQKQLNYTPFQTGQLIFFGSLPFIIFSPIGGFLADHLSFKIPLIIGFVLSLLGFLLLLIFPIKEEYNLLIGLLLIGGGIALARSPSFSFALEHAVSHHMGAAVSIIKTNRQFASTLGLALVAAITHASYEKSSYQVAFYSIVTLFLIFSALCLLITFLVLKRD